MISNQILQNTIEGLKGITRIDFCVMDTDGKSLASTFSEQENYVEAVSYTHLCGSVQDTGCRDTGKKQLHAKSNGRYKEESGGCQRIAGSGRDDCVKSGWSGGV